MAQLDPGVVEAVINSNFKTNAEAVSTVMAHTIGLGFQNASSHQNRLNLLAEASLAQQLNRMNGLDPAEASSIETVKTAGLAEKMSELGAAVAALQQMIKTAQTTPPQTGAGG